MENKLIKINGTILVTDRDRAGDIIQIAIEDDNLQRYLILNSKLSKKLYQLVNKRITAYAEVVDEYLNGKPIIRLINFSKENQ